MYSKHGQSASKKFAFGSALTSLMLNALVALNFSPQHRRSQRCLATQVAEMFLLKGWLTRKHTQSTAGEARPSLDSVDSHQHALSCFTRHVYDARVD
jgi:hypothetical protein